VKPQREYTFRNKITVVGRLLQNAQGRLLDVGARDRYLSKQLDPKQISYFSADMSSGHDYQVNLEQPLPFKDREFDHVVALDVLEHVENIHRAFADLARLASKDFIVALPNLAALPRRFSFLFGGHLMTKKYDLLPDHQGDRHRWFTVYSQINRFVEEGAAKSGMRVDRIVEEIDGNRWFRVGGWALAKTGLMPRGLLTGRCIYFLTRC
jgi:hypothetical protein